MCASLKLSQDIFCFPTYFTSTSMVLDNISMCSVSVSRYLEQRIFSMQDILNNGFSLCIKVECFLTDKSFDQLFKCLHTCICMVKRCLSKKKI